MTISASPSMNAMALPFLTGARLLLIAYALVLPIRGTAALQAVLVLTSLCLLLWTRRGDLQDAWWEIRWICGPLLIFSIWIFLVCGFWREPPLRNWDPGSWDMQQPWFSLDQWRRDIAQPMLAMLCGWWAFRSDQWRRILFVAFAVFLLVLLGKCLSQFYLGEYLDFRGGGGVHLYKGTLFVRGFSRDNIFFSYVLLLLSPGIIWLVVDRPSAAWRKVLAWGAFLVLCYLIYLNKRRGTWLAFYVELLFVVAWMGRRRFLIFLVLTLLMSATAFELRPHWFAREYDSQSPHHIGRMEVVRKYWTLIGEHPWVGVGLGKDAVVKNYWHRIYQHAHNTFGNLLLEVGWPGLALWLAALGVYIRRFSRHPDPWLGRLGLAFVIAFCVRNLFDDIWLSSNAELFWFLTGVFMPDTRTSSRS